MFQLAPLIASGLETEDMHLNVIFVIIRDNSITFKQCSCEGHQH